MARFPWLKLRKKTEPELPLEPPIWLGSHSNGEYFHQQTPQEARMRRAILQKADEHSRRLGIDRREFLASTMGMAVSLAVLNQMGCDAGDDGGGGDGTGSDQPFIVPQEATCQPSDFVSGDQFIFDIQTHSFDDGEWRQSNIVYPIFLSLFANCDNRVDPLDCFDQNRYGEIMFVDSETTMAVISAWPAATCSEMRQLFGRPARACGLPLSNEGMRRLRDFINSKAMSQRVVNQVQVMPNDNLDLQLDIMRMTIADPEWQTVAGRIRARIFPHRSDWPQIHRNRPATRHPQLCRPQGPADPRFRRRAQQSKGYRPGGTRLSGGEFHRLPLRHRNRHGRQRHRCIQSGPNGARSF
jgi:hypothetical protein